MPEIHPSIHHRRSRLHRLSSAALGLLLLGNSSVGCAAANAGSRQQAEMTTAERKELGAKLYGERCAACHDHATGRIPTKVYITVTRAPEDVIQTLSRGVMQAQAAGLTEADIRAVAVYLTGREPSHLGGPNLDANRCSKPPVVRPPGPGDWNGWGLDAANTRYQPDAGFTAAVVGRLKPKWTFAYPGPIAFAQPTVVGDLVLTGGTGGILFALDRSTGCTHWHYDAGNLIRTTPVVGVLVAQAKGKPGRASRGQLAVWIGDDKGNMHALDLATGRLLWKRRIDEHPMARLVGTPKLQDGVLYAPVSSFEEVAAADPKYVCCTFRGSIYALDANTGNTLWQGFTIKEPAKQFKTNDLGTPMFGPAGGAIFNSPTLDNQRNLIYAGTGDSYTDVDTDSIDAVIAMSPRDGSRVWTQQVLERDSWLLGCDGKPVGNCPEELGPDFDFASSPVLARMKNGRQVIVAGNKSGTAYAFDPDAAGKRLWNRHLVEGSSHGGILWGAAADDVNMYVAASGYDLQKGTGPGALYALDLATGAVNWSTVAPRRACAWGEARCAQSMISAVSAMPGLVFAGAMDGRIRAYDARDGRILWEFDTSQTFDTVNKVKAHGGAIDYGGQVMARGMLFVNSGSARQPGNLLIAFSVDGK